MDTKLMDKTSNRPNDSVYATICSKLGIKNNLKNRLKVIFLWGKNEHKYTDFINVSDNICCPVTPNLIPSGNNINVLNLHSSNDLLTNGYNDK